MYIHRYIQHFKSTQHTFNNDMSTTESDKEDKSQMHDAPSKAETTIENKEPKVAEGFDDETADVDIVSSDNVIFRVHSYNLMCHR